MSPDSSTTPMPVPASISSLGNVPEAPVFGQNTAKRAKVKSQSASFLSGAALPDRGTQGGKTLTGQ